MKMRMLSPIALALLAGCATNPFAQFYHDNMTQFPPEMQQRLLPPSANPEIIVVAQSDAKVQARHLMEKGFAALGFAGFKGSGKASRNNLTEQAKKVGADVVIYSSQYSHTERGVQAVSTYEPGQTYTTTSYGSATANIYGGRYNAYGYGNYSDYTTTSSSGTVHTDYVPYERRVNEHSASFWRRVKPGVFGAVFKAIPDDLRSKLQRNTGAYIDVVVNDSPAFKANIMQADVLIGVADKPVSTDTEAGAIIRSYAGQKVPVKVIRANRTVTLEVQLNPIM